MNVCDMMAPLPTLPRCLEGVPAGSTVPCSLIQIQTSSRSRCLRCAIAVVAVMGHIYGSWIDGKNGVVVDYWTLVFDLA